MHILPNESFIPIDRPPNIIKILFHIQRKVSSFSMSLYQFALNMRYILSIFYEENNRLPATIIPFMNLAFSHNMYSANRNTTFFIFFFVFLYLSSECEIVHLSSDSILSVFSLKGCFYPFLIYSSQFIHPTISYRI